MENDDPYLPSEEIRYDTDKKHNSLTSINHPPTIDRLIGVTGANIIAIMNYIAENDEEAAAKRLLLAVKRLGSALTNIKENDHSLAMILCFLDVPTLIKMKAVSRKWRKLCTATIDQKGCFSPQRKQKPFTSNRELRGAVIKYVNSRRKPKDAEKIAKRYGWPINKWDVSLIEDFSSIFDNLKDFNEDIGSWDVSNARNMSKIFFRAFSFNKDIGSWNTKNVKFMNSMFECANSFNKNISTWNTSNVIEMSSMFAQASNFNQDISS